MDTVTPRERDVLQLMAEGLSNHAIAARLVITQRAVETSDEHLQTLRLAAGADADRRVLGRAGVPRAVTPRRR